MFAFEFCETLGTLFLQNASGRLLLKKCLANIQCWFSYTAELFTHIAQKNADSHLLKKSLMENFICAVSFHIKSL